MKTALETLASEVSPLVTKLLGMYTHDQQSQLPDDAHGIILCHIPSETFRFITPEGIVTSSIPRDAAELHRRLSVDGEFTTEGHDDQPWHGAGGYAGRTFKLAVSGKDRKWDAAQLRILTTFIEEHLIGALITGQHKAA